MKGALWGDAEDYVWMYEEMEKKKKKTSLSEHLPLSQHTVKHTVYIITAVSTELSAMQRLGSENCSATQSQGGCIISTAGNIQLCSHLSHFTACR